MNIYFYIVNPDQTSKDIGHYLKKVGMVVSSNFDNPYQQKNNLQFQSLDKIDLLLVYGQKIDQQGSYLLAATLSQGKKVLCLLPQETKIDESLKNLQSDKILAKKLKILFFEKDWKSALAEYFQGIDQSEVKELFNIKYTLRVSRKISDYLNWKNKNIGANKADWIRERIQEIMDSDQKYQEYLKNRFSK